MKNEIQKVGKGNELVIFNQLNFDDLNKSIVLIGKAKKLTEKEKEIGVQLLGDWENNVISKIDTKSTEMHRLKEYITGGNTYYMGDEEKEVMIENLVNISKTRKQYNVYLEAKQVVKDNKLNQPEGVTIDPMKTIVENEKEQANYNLKYSTWRIEESKLDYKVTESKKKWLSVVRKSKQVKELLKGVDAYILQLKKYKTECNDKTQLAKLNIAISNDDVRTAIKDMIEFTKRLD